MSRAAKETRATGRRWKLVAALIGFLVVHGLLVSSSLRKVWLAVDYYESMIQAGAVLYRSGQLDPLYGRKLTFEGNSSLPQWMLEYFDWHTVERATLTPENWEYHRYLVMRCWMRDGKCGGASDRLQSLPWALSLAQQSKRLLFIHWERPAPLQEYLVPCNEGIDWTVPAWLADFWLEKRPSVQTSGGNKTLVVALRNDTLVTLRQQANDHGADAYNSWRKTEGEPTFDEVMGPLWHTLFQPAPTIAGEIDERLHQLGLQSGNYVAVHHRSKYIKDRSDEMDAVHNSIHCATQMNDSQPIYFASDSRNVSREAVEYGKRSGLQVSALLDSEDPLHLDRGHEFFQNSNASMSHASWKYNDVFVDLYLLAGGSCTVYGIGGFGYWASLLSKDRTCRMKHHKTPCELEARNTTAGQDDEQQRGV